MPQSADPAAGLGRRYPAAALGLLDVSKAGPTYRQAPLTAGRVCRICGLDERKHFLVSRAAACPAVTAKRALALAGGLLVCEPPDDHQHGRRDHHKNER